MTPRIEVQLLQLHHLEKILLIVYMAQIKRKKQLLALAVEDEVLRFVREHDVSERDRGRKGFRSRQPRFFEQNHLHSIPFSFVG